MHQTSLKFPVMNRRSEREARSRDDDYIVAELFKEVSFKLFADCDLPIGSAHEKIFCGGEREIVGSTEAWISINIFIKE